MFFSGSFCVGILAGMRPCGMIVLLNELFTSESKSQVYGCLHNYYTLHPVTAKDIGKPYSCSVHVSISMKMICGKLDTRYYIFATL